MLEELGHQVWIGHATEIRRRARRDRRRTDEMRADPGFVVKNEFPRIHRVSAESREVLRQLRYRHRLVQQRTRSYNSLQAIALSAGFR